jgi:hypothetical protein
MWRTNQLLVVIMLLAAGAVTVVATAGTARLLTGSLVVAALVLGILRPAGDVFRSTFLPWPNVDLVFYKEGPTDTVGVGEGNGQRIIVYEDHAARRRRTPIRSTSSSATCRC